MVGARGDESRTVVSRTRRPSTPPVRGSGPAFAEHYQRIDQKYARMVTISFDATAGRSYGLSGEFNQGATPGESGFSINAFDTETKEVVARSSSSNPQERTKATVSSAPPCAASLPGGLN